VTDSRLQELKRAWDISGAVEDGAAYLIERVRVGDLTSERLAVAACCGYEPGIRASGGTAPLMSDGPPDRGPKSFRQLSKQFLALCRFSDDVIARGVVAAGWGIVDHYGSHGEDARRVLHMAERVLCSPTESCKSAVRTEICSEFMLLGDDGATRVDLTSAAHRLAICAVVGLCDAYDLERDAYLLLNSENTYGSFHEHVMKELDVARDWFDVMYENQSDPEEHGLMRDKDRQSFDCSATQRVQSELIDWSLGNVDPVQLRVLSSEGN